MDSTLIPVTTGVPMPYVFQFCQQLVRLAAIVMVAAGMTLSLATSPILAQVSSEYARLEGLVNQSMNAQRYREALPYAQQLAALAVRDYGRNSRAMYTSHWKLANTYYKLDQWEPAEQAYAVTLKNMEAYFGSAANHKDIAEVLFMFGHSKKQQGKYPEALEWYQRAMNMHVALGGPQQSIVVFLQFDIAETYRELQDYRRAQEAFEKTLEAATKVLGGGHPFVARCTSQLATTHRELGDFEEAERLYRQALSILERAGPGGQAALPQTLNSLGNLHRLRGFFVEADACYRTARDLIEAAPQRDLATLAAILNNHAIMMREQNRLDESEATFREVLSYREKVLGPEHPFVATTADGLAAVLETRDRLSEAEALRRRALAIAEKTFGPRGADTLVFTENLAATLRQQKKWVECESLLDSAITGYTEFYGPRHWRTANCRFHFSELGLDLERFEAARQDIDEAIAVFDAGTVSTRFRSLAYAHRARLAWAQNQRDAAIADLEKALQLAEETRLGAAGAEQEIAQSFASFREQFEQMVGWQLAMNNVEGVFQTIERQRARSLLDELRRGRVDFQAGKTLEQRQEFYATERALREQLAQLERDLEVAIATQPRDEQNIERVARAISVARQRQYEFYRDERGSNPLYRQITRDAALPTLQHVFDQILGKDSIALLYHIGEDTSLVLTFAAGATQFAELTVDEAAARTLGVTAGPLNRDRLNSIIMGIERKQAADPEIRGVVQLLAQHPKKVTAEVASDLQGRLATLWRVLIPAAAQTAILDQTSIADGRHRRLIILPDGPLAVLPFESLIVQPGVDPVYLLDVGPPVAYAPSMSVLLNLKSRPVSTGALRKALTLSDPEYPQTAAEGVRRPLLTITQRERYAGFGVTLSRLPFTAEEGQAVAASWTRAGYAVTSLQQRAATEAGFRSHAAQARVLHLACHGLADQAYGNFFGALALMPGPQSQVDPLDDGFLTMPEVYALDLGNCELAILSACETNFGPRQVGEGTWALSRAFLIAGARRVVASNWLVNDEATANLISRYTSQFSSDSADGKPVDYAEALQAAKRWQRAQHAWSSPYFWSSFVLLGPANQNDSSRVPHDDVNE